MFCISGIKLLLLDRVRLNFFAYICLMSSVVKAGRMRHKQPSIISRFPIVVGRHIQPDSILLAHDQFPRVGMLP